MSRRKGQSLRRRLLAVLIGTAASLVLFELGLRWLVLSDSAAARSLGTRVRDASRFAGADDDAYWKLLYLFDPASASSAARPDRMCGWLTHKIGFVSHEHMDAVKLGERTPALLYGDSFAEGVIPGPGTFEELLETTPTARTHRLLNYGVGGYGFDQAFLMMRDTLPRWKSRDPVVMLSLLIDDDLDRCVLTFRCGAKPRFHVVDGKLVDPEPVETDLKRFLELHPVGITSYVVRLIARRDGLLPAWMRRTLLPDESRWKEKQALAAALLHAACRELRADTARGALLLMRSSESVRRPRVAGWQEDLVRRVALEEGVPVLDTRDALLAEVHGNTQLLESLYVTAGPAIGHLNKRGNLVVLQVMRAFMEGQAPEKALEYVHALEGNNQLADVRVKVVKSEWLGGTLLVKYSEGSEGFCFTQSKAAPGRSTGPSIGVRAGDCGPSTLRWTPPPGMRQLSLALRAVQQGPGASSAELVVHVRQREGGETLSEETLHLSAGQPAQDWHVDLQGVLELRIDPPGPGQRSAWLKLEPRVPQ